MSDIERQFLQYKEIIDKWDANAITVALVMEVLKVTRFQPDHELANSLRALADLIDGPFGKPE